ncbi:MAG: hypothetical protein Q9202_000670 [Teloschistes flavicans]
MSSRKRGRAEMESLEPAPELSLLQRIRNAWEFSNLMQFIFTFGKAVKIDEDFSIEELETECLKVGPSEKLTEIGLALLKCVSSHRGLTPALFDEYTRRQYVAKAPERNPFGIDETPKKFDDFDVFTKLSVLCQLSRWTFVNADRMREKMSEVQDAEQLSWRVDEIGYDKQERYYFVLDDNRLYRRTDPPLPPPPAPKPKANSKKAKAAARAGKRRKTNNSLATEDGDEHETTDEAAVENGVAETTDETGFAGRKWECLAVSLTDYKQFLESIQKSKDPDEKALHSRLIEEVLPVIEKEEESKQRRQARKERELMNVEKLAGAKRSSRLASKFESERAQREAAEAEQKKKADLAAAHAYEAEQKRREEDRGSRLMTREQRIKEREHKRILQEEELAALSEDSKKVDNGEARKSERRLKSEVEKRKKDLAALTEEDSWTFDCAKCGVHGENLDDGTHSLACEKCNVWQHSACLGISQTAAEKDDFHFVCQDCKRRAEDAAKPKIPPLKFHLGSSSSPPNQKPQNAANDSKKRKAIAEGGQLPPLKKFKPAVDVHPPSMPPAEQIYPNASQHGMHQALMNGPTLAQQAQAQHQSAPYAAQTLPPPGLQAPSVPPAYTNGYIHNVDQHDNHALQGQAALPAYGSKSHLVNGNSQIYDINGARHAVHQTPQRPSYQAQPNQNPYLNTFERQRSASSHATNNIPPIKKTPMQTSPSFNHENTPRLSPYTNGAMPSPTNLPAALPPPVKQQTSPPPPALHPSSSSPINGPVLHNDTPSSPGFSPTKQSSPRARPSLDLANAPILPPLSDFAPTSGPRSPQHSPTIKPLNLEQQMQAVNGSANHQ